ncbi:hypothetical protein Tco_0266542 [Tanacetum coccineum]
MIIKLVPSLIKKKMMKRLKMMKEEEEEEIVKTPSNNSDDKDEIKITDKAEGDEDEEIDYTTSLLYDDVDIRMNEPVDADKGFVQEEGTNATMTNIQQGNENQEIIQVIEDAHVTLSTILHMTEVLVSSSSHSSDLATKFLNFLDIPTTEAEFVSPLDVPVHHEIPSQQTPTLPIVAVSVISESSPVFSTVIPQSLQSFTPPPRMSTPTPPPTTKATNPSSTLPDFESVFQFNNRVTTLKQEVAELKKDPLHTQVTTLVDEHLDAKRSRKDKDKDEDLYAGSDRGLKKRKTSKDAEPTKGPKEEPEFEVADSDIPQDQEENLGNDDVEPKEKVASKRDWFTKPTQPQEPTDPDWNVDKTPHQGQDQSWLMTLASSDDKPLKTFDDLMSTLIDFSTFIMNGLKINNLTKETLLGPAFRLLKGTRSNYAELEYDFEECYKALSEKLDWENPEGDDYPFDLTKPLPLVMSRNRQKVPVDYFFNNDLKYLQGGISTMTYTTSLIKTKAAQYDLVGIEDMVPNIWVPVKVAYDKLALWGISHWREQRKSFYRYARGQQSRHDVYTTKCIMAVTQVEVTRKHGYGYLKEIVVRRADNVLYRFKEGDFPRLRVNDIEDTLLLVVQNWLTNLSGDDISDLAITLRMFTRSLVTKKQVEDLQLGVKTYLKRSTSPGYKLPYPTLGKETHILHTKTLKDSFMSTIIRWSTLEKKQANSMIKAINKQLKERTLMRSLKKFVGGRDYGTDLRLLRLTI